MSDLSTAARLASLAAEDDPSLRERVERALERVKRIEESVGMLMHHDVQDVPMPDVAAPVTAAPVAPPAASADNSDPGDVPPGATKIGTWADLKQAVADIGKATDQKAMRAYIKRRAVELHAENTLPDGW